MVLKTPVDEEGAPPGGGGPLSWPQFPHTEAVTCLECWIALWWRKLVWQECRMRRRHNAATSPMAVLAETRLWTCLVVLVEEWPVGLSWLVNQVRSESMLTCSVLVLGLYSSSTVRLVSQGSDEVVFAEPGAVGSLGSSGKLGGGGGGAVGTGGGSLGAGLTW